MLLLAALARASERPAPLSPPPEDGERADTSELPLPEWRPQRPGYGFDFGVIQGGRVRIPVGDRAVSEIDLRVGFTYGLPYAGWILVTGGEARFGHGGPVRFVGSLNLGFGPSAALVGAVGAGVQLDPRGPFELHVGALAALSVYGYPFYVPDLTASWMW